MTFLDGTNTIYFMSLIVAICLVPDGIQDVRVHEPVSVLGPQEVQVVELGMGHPANGHHIGQLPRQPEDVARRGHEVVGAPNQHGGDEAAGERVRGGVRGRVVGQVQQRGAVVIRREAIYVEQQLIKIVEM